MEKGLYILGNVVGGCMRDSHVDCRSNSSVLDNHKNVDGGAKMTRLIMTAQLCFFIAYGTLSGIAWRGWSARKVEQAEVNMLISLPLNALVGIPVTDNRKTEIAL